MKVCRRDRLADQQKYRRNHSDLAHHLYGAVVLHFYGAVVLH